MEQVQILAIEDVLATAQQAPNRLFEMNGVRFKQTETIRTIMDKGTTCSCCGEDALYFTYFKNKDDGTINELRLMFGHKNKKGEYAYMTKDHIIPKALGGPDKLSNYQPMCNICNIGKGASLDVNSVPEHLLQYVSPDAKIRIPKLASKQTINPLVRPAYTQYEVLYYKGWIRWYTMSFHRGAGIQQWSTTIRSIIAKQLKQQPNFNAGAFNVAFLELIKEVKSHPSHKPQPKKGIGGPIRPATLFTQNNNR